MPISEKEILKHLFTDKTQFKVVLEKNLKSSIFIEEDAADLNRFKILFDIASDYHRNYNDVLARTSLVRVLAASKANDDTSAKLLSAYDEVSLTDITAPIAFLIDSAKKDYKRVKLRGALTKAADLYRANALEDVVPYMQKEFFDITHDIDEFSSEASVSESVEERREALSQGKRPIGVPTGFPTFDTAAHGLTEGQLVIIAAATNEGKSVMLLNIAHNAWLAEKNVLYVTVENYRPDLMRRFDSLDAMVPYSHLKNGTMTDDEKIRMEAAFTAQKARSNVFYVVDKPADCTPEFIESKINDLLPIKFDVIVVDYLGIMKLSTKHKVERDEYFGNIASELRRIGRIKKIPVVTAVQVNREGMKEKGNAYGVQHVAMSQLISNHADIIVSLRAIDQAQAMASGVVDLECALIKHRDGPKVRFAMKANFERMKLQEQEIRCEDIAVMEQAPTQEALT